ncbi:Uncharacterised protein [Mycobacterium tuberculosis]|nr:Uncharacterised protein [Mycobacterium tuberculosis]
MQWSGHPQGGRPGAGGARSGSHPGAGCGGAVVERPHRGVLHPDDGRPWRGARVRRRHALAQAAGQGPQGDSGRRRRAGARALPQPLRTHPVVLRRFRGCAGVPATQDVPNRVRADEGALRGFHAGRALPGVCGHPAQARDSGGDAGWGVQGGARRQVHRRGV